MRGLIMIAFLVAAAPPAMASDKPDARVAEARAHYDRGSGLFALERYDDAIKEFEQAFLLVQKPDFLFNIGQAHRKAGRPDRARTYFERYLDLVPDASDRAEVERLIAETRQRREPAPAPTVAPPPQPPDPKPAPPPVAAVPPAALTTPQQPADRTRPRWLWPVVGTGAAVVVAGVVVGAVLATRPPSTDFGIVEPFQ